jgi:DNA repair exonuclease SbcCD ATPase subunit
MKKLTTLKGKIQQKFSTHQKEHQFFSENESCPTCGQHIDAELKQEKISKIMNSITELNKGFDEIKETIRDYKNITTPIIIQLLDYNNKSQCIPNYILYATYDSGVKPTNYKGTFILFAKSSI